MTIAFDGGRDGQRQGGGEKTVTKMAFDSGGGRSRQCDGRREPSWRWTMVMAVVVDDGDGIRRWRRPVGVCGGIGKAMEFDGGSGGGNG